MVKVKKNQNILGNVNLCLGNRARTSTVFFNLSIKVNDNVFMVIMT